MNFPSQRRPTRRGPNFFLLFVMAMMAFFLYSQYKKGNRQADVESTIPDITIPDISNDHGSTWPTPGGSTESPWPAPSREQRNPHSEPANSDWAMEDLPSIQAEGQTPVSVGPEPGKRSSSKSGDWMIEEGHSRPNQPHIRPSAPKKKHSGDWSIEEVETKP